MPEVGKVDKCIESIYKIMTKPCKRLVNEATGVEGLKIDVEVSMGQNWRDMEEIKV